MDIKSWTRIFTTLAIVLVQTDLQDVGKVNGTQEWEGIKKARIIQPFVCTKVQTRDFSESVGMTTAITEKLDSIKTTRNEGERTTSTEPTTSLDISDPPVTTLNTRVSTALFEGITTTATSKVVTTNTSSVFTQANGIASMTVPSNHGTIDDATRVSTALPTIRVTSRSNTSMVSSSPDNFTDPVDVTTSVSSNPPTTTFTTTDTTTEASTKTSTLDTTDVSTTDQTKPTTDSSTSDPAYTGVSYNPPTTTFTTTDITIETSTETSIPDTTDVSTTYQTKLTTDSTTSDPTDVTTSVSSDPPTTTFTTTDITIETSTETSTLDTTDESTTDQTKSTTGSTTSVTCPSGYSTTFSNSCYRISNDTDGILSRSDARKLCESESSHLVFIESAEEDDFLTNVTLPDEQYWIGANGLPDKFYWDDGSSMEYRKFDDGGIAFDDGRGCYRMRIDGGNTTWPDAPCFRKYNYICEYEVGRETKECPDDISICSDKEWTNLMYEWEATEELQDSVLAYFDGEAFLNGFKPLYASRGIHSFVYRSNDTSQDWCSFRLVTDCMTWEAEPKLNISYALVKNWLRWHEAVKACIFYDSHLVSVENEDENFSLQSVISNDTIDRWIGLSYSSNEGMWKWNRPNSMNVFFNWANDQPNTFHSCTVIDHVTAEWKTKSCGLPRPFVCERRKDE